jgi:uncharacterized protein
MLQDADDFLGTGWAFPPTFDRATAAVRMSSDDLNIQQNLWVLLSTRLGERLMLASYGTPVWWEVFDALTSSWAKSVQTQIATAILDWEPRIDVRSIVVQQLDASEGRFAIAIDYVIRSTNSRSNLVYPFYKQEGTIPPAPI